MLKILQILTFLILNGHSIYNPRPLTVHFRPSTKTYIPCLSTGEKSSISNFLTASRKIYRKPFILLFVLFGFLVLTCSESKSASLLLNKPNLHAAAIISNNKPSSFNKVCKRRDRDGSFRYASHKSDIKYSTRSGMWWLSKWLSLFQVQHSCAYCYNSYWSPYALHKSQKITFLIFWLIQHFWFSSLTEFTNVQ